jgi:hypothetical protein
MDFDECVLHRMAYGLADQLREASVCRGSGRWRSNPAAGGDPGAVLAEVLRRLAVADRAGRELVRGVRKGGRSALLTVNTPRSAEDGPTGGPSETREVLRFLVSVRQMVRAVSAVLDCSVPPSGPNMGFSA